MQRRRITPLRLLTICGISGTLLFVGASFLFAILFTSPARRTVTPPDSTAVPGMTDVAFRASDGVTLRGWYVPAPGSDRGVVLLHGYRGDRGHMISRAQFLHDAGYNVLLYDARACGESGGESTSIGYHETADLLAALQVLRNRGSRRLACLGVSQGGATILLAASRLGDVACVICESTYDDMTTAIDRRFRHYLGVPGWLGASLMTPFAAMRLGVDIDSICPVERVDELRCPLLIVSGERDTRVPLADTRRLFAAARQPKALLTIPGADHEDLHAFSGEEYERMILAFLDRYCR